MACLWMGSVESGCDVCGWVQWKVGTLCFGVMTLEAWCDVFWSDDCGSLVRRGVFWSDDWGSMVWCVLE